jgi:hypothetical protein
VKGVDWLRGKLVGGSHCIVELEAVFLQPVHYGLGCTSGVVDLEVSDGGMGWRERS